jgi:putative lipoprotein
MRNAMRLAALATILALASLGSPSAATATLTGEVTYLERIAMPGGSSLKVRLIDLTAPGTPTRVEAEAPIATPGEVPLSFTLNFDDAVLVPDHQHALIAEIVVGLELWFRNAQPYELNPLAPEAPVMVTANFVGRLLGAEVQPEEPEEEDTPEPTILELTWRAQTIGGTPVLKNVDSTLSITSDMRAGGRGGCNSYFAQAELGPESLRFSAIAATRMACLNEATTAQETAFFTALQSSRFWQLDGDTLILLDATGEELVRFASR